ncbi:Uncharacterised protein [Bordetella pertussis]|nr:Uncharacterised protein [Bordetella pertussis]CFD97679.1 Uncharacterised protein [Bordetella pertussis]CFE03771.1 Uncharacterised protein [Bordetella pertussis]CFL89781.1 Uncharacterised protein [Bordetella pertussis]CFL98587.1 Uncharacterised protein [Bordetella pertussis]
MPAISEARAPYTMRLKMSRPSSSVPIQNAAEGALRMVMKLVWNESWLATQGASSASTTNASTMSAPSIAIRLRRNLPQERLARRGAAMPALAMGALMRASGGG